MKLSSRFLLDSLFVLAGAFLAVTSMAWAAGTAGWTAFGVSTGGHRARRGQRRAGQEAGRGGSGRARRPGRTVVARRGPVVLRSGC